MKYHNTLSFAQKADREDPLRIYRRAFWIPRIRNKKAIYFASHSLGLQSKKTKSFVLAELKKWSNLGVRGHHEGPLPWITYHKSSKRMLAKIVGAHPSEVIAMNQLTVNLHLMMISFYRPTKKRFKILVEDALFSSDRYAIVSQIKLHGFNPDEALLTLTPRKKKYCLSTEDIIRAINNHRDELALILLGGVQYHTGQFFDLTRITRAGQRANIPVGYDLAHAVGNVPLHLHRDNVDFAIWCGYKYMGGGPGCMGGIFVHSKHNNNVTMPRLAGWWGHDERNRFQMERQFKPMPGADGWQLSNVPILTGAAHLAALSVFEKIGIQKLRKKSIALTGYFYFLLKETDPSSEHFEIITPEDPQQRGCQLSLLIKKRGRRLFDILSQKGIVADWRSPSIIRLAPAPLYNTYTEVYRCVKILGKAIHTY